MGRKINFYLFFAIMTLSVGSEARSLENDSHDDDSTDFLADSGLPVPFSLEEIYKGGYHAMPFNGSWISENEIIYDDLMGAGIVKFNVETHRITTVLEAEDLNKYGTSYSYDLSADHSHLLIGYAPQTKFRHSEFRKYDVYNLKNNSSEKIANGQHILLALWSPVGNSLIYEIDNDLYYREVAGNGSAMVRRLTTDGVVGVIYNGLPDWVYEEEVIGTGSRLWFSPDGKHLAFASFNDTEVQDAAYYYYGAPGDMHYQYPVEVKIKYPKVGTKNPQVSLNLVDLTDANSKIISLKAPIDVVSLDHILYTVNWFTNNSVAAVWTNRVQNIAQLVTYDIFGKSSYLLKIEEKEGWIEVPKPVLYGNKVLLLKYQVTDAIAGRYNHVTSYDLINGSSLTNEKDLSPLGSAVQTFLRVDEKSGKIYYLATAPGEPSQRNLYSTPVDGKERPTCISCSLLTPEGNFLKARLGIPAGLLHTDDLKPPSGVFSAHAYFFFA